MKCPECNAENRIDRLYCDNCGAQLEHELRDVQDAVDKEIRDERAKSTGRAVRWLLAVSIVLAFAGYYFRGAYKTLPENELVAFAIAPTTLVNDRLTVTTDQFGVPLPAVKAIVHPTVSRDRRATDQALRDAAYRRAAVRLKHRGNRTPIQGLLLGDLVIYVPQPDGKKPIAVHIADIRSLRPTIPGEWEIRAVNLPQAVKTGIANHRKVRIRILEPKPGGDPTVHDIPLANVQFIEPATQPKAP